MDVNFEIIKYLDYLPYNMYKYVPAFILTVKMNLLRPYKMPIETISRIQKWSLQSALRTWTMQHGDPHYGGLLR